MIDEVKKKTLLLQKSTKFVESTMQTAEVVAFSESIKLVEKIGLNKISDIEDEVLRYGIDKMRKNNSITLIGEPQNKASVISFTIKEFILMTSQPFLMMMVLQYEQDTTVVKYCMKIGVPATSRASIGLYNSKEDIDILINAINKCKKVLNYNGIKRLISRNNFGSR